MSAIFAQQRAAGGAIIFGQMGFNAPSGPGRITSGALVWNNNIPHRAALFDVVVRSLDGLTMVLNMPAQQSVQDVDGDWIVTFLDASLTIGQWYEVRNRRPDIGTRGAIGIEYVQATA